MNKNGKHTEFHKNGQKSSEENFKDNKLDGFWAGWHENGQKSYEETYKDGELISKKCWDWNGNERGPY